MFWSEGSVWFTIDGSSIFCAVVQHWVLIDGADHLGSYWSLEWSKLFSHSTVLLLKSPGSTDQNRTEISSSLPVTDPQSATAIISFCQREPCHAFWRRLQTEGRLSPMRQVAPPPEPVSVRAPCSGGSEFPRTLWETCRTAAPGPPGDTAGGGERLGVGSGRDGKWGGGSGWTRWYPGAAGRDANMHLPKLPVDGVWLERSQVKRKGTGIIERCRKLNCRPLDTRRGEKVDSGTMSSSL